MTRILQRTLSMSLAAMLTLAMLGGIDQLSQPGADARQQQQWALQNSVRA